MWRPTVRPSSTARFISRIAVCGWRRTPSSPAPPNNSDVATGPDSLTGQAGPGATPNKSTPPQGRKGAVMSRLARTITRILDQHYPPTWTDEEHQLRVRGLTVTRGRLGSITVRDPRFDQIEACPDCHGSGVDSTVRCPHTVPPCDWCTMPCPTCEGHGTIRATPAATTARGL